MEKISKAHLKELTKLKQKKYRELTNTAIVEGVRIVQQLVSNNIAIEELITSELEINLTSYPAKKYIQAEEWQMEKLASTKTPQSIVAVVAIDLPEIKRNNFLLYLENINDPGNLGTIFRTALAAGIDGIVLSPNCCELSNPKLIRSSLGAVFCLPSVVKPISWLFQQNALIIATTSHNAKNIFEIPVPTENKILVLGSEAHGISNEILVNSGLKVKIPISSQIESLNVAVAAGICIYHFSHAPKLD